MELKTLYYAFIIIPVKRRTGARYSGRSRLPGTRYEHHSIDTKTMNAQSPTPFPKNDRYVLITGCSSGIGRQTAITLAANEFVVFATVRKVSDADELRGLGLHNLLPVFPLDLTDRDHMTNAAETVASEIRRRGGNGLYALINNAGGGRPAPVELMDLEMFRSEIDARLIGSIGLVQALLPLIRQGNGRILWIATPAMIPTPYVASIHACDFAVNCLARTLDIELKRWHIRNILIRCGGIKTPSGLRTTADVRSALEHASPERSALYADAFTKWGEDMSVFDRKRTKPEKVARLVLKALTASEPRRRYSVGYMSRMAALLEALPQPVTDWILKKRF
jgi:NAD(P)-dependent dehydrogenase (short-subunit alcohol dehydrogenase family)